MIIKYIADRGVGTAQGTMLNSVIRNGPFEN